MKNISVGDTVIAVAGRDKGQAFVVLEVGEKFCLIANGKTRKVDNPKKKNLKHLIKVNSEISKDITEKISNGLAIGNKKLSRKLKNVQQ